MHKVRGSQGELRKAREACTRSSIRSCREPSGTTRSLAKPPTLLMRSTQRTSTNNFVTGVLYLSPPEFSIVNLTLPPVSSFGILTISASFE